MAGYNLLSTKADTTSLNGVWRQSGQKLRSSERWIDLVLTLGLSLVCGNTASSSMLTILLRTTHRHYAELIMLTFA
jgi:hypothetical protein